jgi:hypothetical protein
MVRIKAFPASAKVAYSPNTKKASISVKTIAVPKIGKIPTAPKASSGVARGGLPPVAGRANGVYQSHK